MEKIFKTFSVFWVFTGNSADEKSCGEVTKHPRADGAQAQDG